MSDTVRTKLHVPESEVEMVARPQLMALLDRSLSARLTLVCAPAGYGKTTTVTEWIHGLALPDQTPAAPATWKVAWYALDPDDDDLSTFFSRFASAVENVSPGAFAGVATGLAILSIPVEAYANSLATACLQLPERVLLVLDDYHLIREPAIHAVIQHLVQYAASRLHLVVVSRHDPPLRLTRLRSQQQIVEVRAHQLRLSDNEATALLALRMGIQPAPDFVADLQTRTEGWAAGLQLAAVALQGEPDQELFVHEMQRDESHFAADYLLDEVLARTPDDVREFLLRTSLANRFSAELAATITGFEVARCRQTIGRLREENLFVVELDRERGWYRYHRQFQAMLVDRARALYTAFEISTTRSEMADWLAGHGFIEEALAENVANRNWDKAITIIESHRQALQGQEELQMLWRWVSQLPEEVVARHPGALLAHAWVLQFQQRPAAIRPIVARVESILLRPVPEWDATQIDSWRGELLALQGSWVFAEREMDERIRLQREALLLLPASGFPWVRGFALNQLAEAMVRAGQRDSICDEVKGEIDAVGINSGVYMTRLLHTLCAILFLDGNLIELEHYGSLYLERAVRGGMSNSEGWARVAVGWSHFQRCQSQQAWDAFRPLFDRAYDSNQLAVVVVIEAFVAISADLDRLAEVAGYVERVRAVAVERENYAAVDELLAYGALISLLRGELQSAIAWADHFVQSWEQHPLRQGVHVVAPAFLVCCEIALTSGSTTLLRKVIPPLEKRANYYREQHVQPLAIQASNMLACCYWRIGQTANALYWMQSGMESGVPRGYRRAFFARGADLPAILYSLIQRGIAVEMASGLLAEYESWRAANACPAPVAPATAGYSALTEREQEILQLLAEKLSNKEIARRLAISPITVRNHTSSIYSKLHVATRKQAIAQAQTLGLLPPPSTFTAAASSR